MDKPTVEYVEAERETMTGRYRRVRIDGKLYHTGVERGRMGRKVFGKRSFRWEGFVRDEKGKTVWSGQVDKATGTRRILAAAGLIPAS